MAKRTCSIPGCGELLYVRKAGLCQGHYKRQWRYGDPLAKTRKTMSAEERFWTFVDKGDGTGCWLWTGYCDQAGYGTFSLAGQPVRAHRFAYTLLVGSIPEGLQLDHVKASGCTSTACVKAVADQFGPTHLEPVTNHENMLRGDTFQGVNARKTHCKRGHLFDEANTLIRIRPHGQQRHCRACAREAARKARRKAHAPGPDCLPLLP